MPAGLVVPVEQYLNTSYRPDCDYVDGEVLERHVGEEAHSWVQREILLFLSRFASIRRRVYPEQRVQVRANRFRIPDLCVLRAGAAREPVVHTPPLLCIEILSKDDSLTDISRRVDDYLNMGVDACWIIDPLGREAWSAVEPGQLSRVPDGILRAGEIEMPLEEVLPPVE